MKIDLALLILENQNLTYEDNCLIFKEVYKFIRRLKRFPIVWTYKYSQDDWTEHAH
jgi:hypothetical protein